MKTKLAALALAAALSLAGCVSNRTLETTIQGRVPMGKPISVAIPIDGEFSGEKYPQSGYGVARRLVSSLLPYFPGSAVGVSNSEYHIIPELLHWENRATEWSGKPDRVKVSLPLYRGQQLIGSALVKAKSSWWTLGGDRPEDLIELPFDVYAAGLAGIKKPNRLVIEK